MKNILIIHPLIFSIFPILFLFEKNKDLINISTVYPPLFTCIFFLFLFFYFTQKLVKNISKTSLITSLFFILFFSYGHFLSFFVPYVKIWNIKILNFNYYFLLFIWIILFISISKLIIDSKNNFRNIGNYLNIVSIILISFSIFNISIFLFKTHNLQNNISKNFYKSNKIENLPDIYYIILDGYGREDVLNDYYRFDNSGFISELVEKNFYIADKSTANYPQTYLSMSSSLNFDYIDKIIPNPDTSSNQRNSLRNAIKNNRIYDFLKTYGYTFVSLPFTWTGTYDNLKSDIIINDSHFNTTSFAETIISTTPLSLLWDKTIKMESLRNKILFSFSNIPFIANNPKPTFTYIHLLSPHPPFIFDENGNDINPNGLGAGLDGSHYFKENPGVEKYRKEYINQLKFINKKTTELVNNILSNSNYEPIIIIQSDHGPGSMLDWESKENTNLYERMSIFNAYLVPENTKTQLYDSITPVNSFRIIFNSVFMENFELLEDKNYFATWDKPFQLDDITDNLNKHEQNLSTKK